MWLSRSSVSGFLEDSLWIHTHWLGSTVHHKTKMLLWCLSTWLDFLLECICHFSFIYYWEKQQIKHSWSESKEYLLSFVQMLEDFLERALGHIQYFLLCQKTTHPFSQHVSRKNRCFWEFHREIGRRVKNTAQNKLKNKSPFILSKALCGCQPSYLSSLFLITGSNLL